MQGWLFRFVLFLLVLFGSIAWWLQKELETAFYGAQSAQVFVEIPRGAGSDRIARLLEESGVLHSRLPFTLYLRWTGKGRQLKAGEYLFNSPLTPVEVAQKIEKGDIFYHSLTIPEGLTAQETLDHIAESGLAAPEDLKQTLARTEWITDLSAEAPSLEGYLFPETYRFSGHVNAEEIVKMMVDRFRDVFTKLRADRATSSGLGIHEVVTLASMIEKESKVSQERGLVASVLLNRLRMGMPLACDPTIIYALKLAGRYDGNIRKADLQINSPYNTYLNPGLPPGPIANPGADSLRAALAPAITDYFYFVARNDGTHEFSKNLKAHQRAVTRFQRSPGRR